MAAIREQEGVTASLTMVVLSTSTERMRVPREMQEGPPRRGRRAAGQRLRRSEASE